MVAPSTFCSKPANLCYPLYRCPDYQCGYGSDWSKVFTMYVLKDGTDWSPRFVIYGDLGYQNGNRSIPLLRNQTNDRQWDVVLHVGECLPAFIHCCHASPSSISLVSPAVLMLFVELILLFVCFLPTDGRRLLVHVTLV